MRSEKSILFVYVLSAAFLLLSVSALAESEKAESQNLFKAKCAMCHGADGAGHTFIGKRDKIPDLSSSAVQEKTDQALSAIIENGKQKMPAFGKKLTPEQIKDLVSYVRELGKNGISAKK